MKEMHGPNPADTEAPQDRTLEPLLKFFKTDERGGHTYRAKRIPFYWNIIKFCTNAALSITCV